MKKLLEADAAVAEAVLPIRDTPAHDMLGWLATLADQPELRALCAGTTAYGLLKGDRKLAWTGLKMLAAHELATATKTFIKHRVDRRRPRSIDDDLEALKPKPGNSHAKEDSSFPSGHAAGASAVARAFARAYPEHAATAYAAAGTAALVQIPRCAHYPTDIGAGLAIGIAAEAATAKVLG